MRGIIFRAKRSDNGEWVEGYLAGYDLICHEEPEDVTDAIGTYYGDHPYVGFVEIKPYTVGQHTGLEDKNGKKIFEGDIVKHIRSGEVRTVIFDERFTGFEFNPKDPVENPDSLILCCNRDHCEVIGNVYDNHELLEEGMNKMRNFHTSFREILDQIQPEDYYISDTYKTTTIYFIVYKDAFNKLFPNKWTNAQSGEISIEFPTNNPAADVATVMISPTLNGYDYDWIHFNLSYEDIELLLKKGNKFIKEEWLCSTDNS